MAPTRRPLPSAALAPPRTSILGDRQVEPIGQLRARVPALSHLTDRRDPHPRVIFFARTTGLSELDSEFLSRIFARWLLLAVPLGCRASRESDLGRLYAHASVVMRAESSTTSERRGMGGHAELRGSAADRIRLGIRGRSLPRAGINPGPWDFCLASPSSAILKPYPSVLTPSWRIRDRIHQPGRPPWVALGALGSVSGDHRGVPDVRVAVSCVVDDRGAANCSPESLTPRIAALRRG